MSELRSVMLFFVGLVVFIVLVAFALGRLRLPTKNTASSAAAGPTPTATIMVTPTPTGTGGGLFGWLFRPRTTPTPRSSTQPVPTRIQPTYIVRVPTSPVQPNKVNGVTTIPETGSPTLLLLVPGALGAVGMWMKRHPAERG